MESLEHGLLFLVVPYSGESRSELLESPNFLRLDLQKMKLAEKTLLQKSAFFDADSGSLQPRWIGCDGATCL